MNKLIPIERVENKIYLIRGQKVMLDYDLAELYEVKTQALNQAVKRNPERFPLDFMFLLSKEEKLRISQFVISSKVKYHKRVFAFTENGVAMLSSVLRSKYAILVNIQIMRAFTKVRRLLTNHLEVSRILKEYGARLDNHDSQIVAVWEAIRKLVAVEEKPKQRIGFLVGGSKEDE
ncbi:MAG: ORF6N domain-containing protein [bacterium]